MHYHIFKGVVDKRTGQINMMQRIRRSFRTRQAASQFVGRDYNWFYTPDGKRIRQVVRCDGMYCLGKN